MLPNPSSSRLSPPWLFRGRHQFDLFCTSTILRFSTFSVLGPLYFDLFTSNSVVQLSVGKGWGRGIENVDFFYLIYWRKQGRGIANWDFSIPFSYTAWGSIKYRRLGVNPKKLESSFFSGSFLLDGIRKYRRFLLLIRLKRKSKKYKFPIRRNTVRKKFPIRVFWPKFPIRRNTL